MIELTDGQIETLATSSDDPHRVVNRRTRAAFVLLPVEVYERLTRDYDDAPWTREELHSLAWQAGHAAGWQDMYEYDAIPEPS